MSTTTERDLVWAEHPVSGYGLLSDGDRLLGGIWPRSFAVWMVAAYIGLYIVRPWEQLAPWLADFKFERVFALFMVAVVVAARGLRFRFESQTIAVNLFVGAMLMSAMFAQDPGLAWSGSSGLYSFLTLACFYFVLISVTKTPYELMFLIACYIVVMVMYVSKCQWEYMFHGAQRKMMGVSRLSGINHTFGHPNALAQSIVLSLPMTLFLYRVRKQFCAAWPAFYQNWFKRVLIFYAVLALVSIVMTNSRMGMVATLAYFGISVLRQGSFGSRATWTLVAFVVIVVAWILMPPETRDRFRSIWDESAGGRGAEASKMGRIEGFKAGMEMFRRFPLTGVGMDNFKVYRYEHVDGDGHSAHNLAGQLLGETGLLGAAGFCVFLMVIVRNTRRVGKMTRGASDSVLQSLRLFTIACQDSLVLLLICGIAGHNLYRFNWMWLAAFALLAVGFTEAILREQQNNWGELPAAHHQFGS